MLLQFFRELALPGCVIQFGTEKTVTESMGFPTAPMLEALLKKHESDNLFFLAGVKNDLSRKFDRARDIDIGKKNYFYLDLDMRKAHPELTDEQLRGEMLEWVQGVLAASTGQLDNWRYITYTGNGFHIYWFGSPVEVPDAEVWKRGMERFINRSEDAFGEKFDRACVNLARIARMPGSNNCKTNPAKPVKILAFQDRKISLEQILRDGAEVVPQSKKPQTQYQSKDDAYAAIDKLPVGRVMCILMGWQLAPDGRHFTEAGKSKHKACFIGTQGNCIHPGGSDYLPPHKDGYSPFQLVKTIREFDDSQTFFWFKAHFPEIKYISDMERVGISEVPQDYGIKSVFEELRKSEEHQLYLGGNWDEWRLLLRGKVTRIGAMPGTGKSKLGYFLTHLLLKKEYKGLFFSTEVSAPDVLAHLLQIRMKKPYLDILEKRVEVPVTMEDDFKNLKVYDVRQTGNQLTRIEQIIKKEYDKSEASNMRGIDFIAIDFSQQVTPKSGKYTDIFNWANEWGTQCQEIAQKYDLAFIDVCQLSIKGNKDEDEKFGHVPYEGGNKLVQTADIASMLSRDKSLSQNNQVVWDVRKSKSMGRRFRMDLEYEWNTGEFRLASAQDSRTDDAGSGFHNYSNSITT